MYERKQKPFLTVETGEAYQPIRLLYHIHDKERLVEKLEKLNCLERNSGGNWNWFWKDECDDLCFDSLELLQRQAQNPLRLGTFSIREDSLQLNLSSFKRACLAVPFFHRYLNPSFVEIYYADFINKVFALDERVAQGFAEFFKEEELLALLRHRAEEYEKLEKACERAESAEKALQILADYTDREMQKKLPFAERYVFDLKKGEDPDLLFLGFYIFLRGRELVAIRRWYGETSFTLGQAADQTVQEVFGDVGVDIIE